MHIPNGRESINFTPHSLHILLLHKLADQTEKKLWGVSIVLYSTHQNKGENLHRTAFGGLVQRLQITQLKKKKKTWLGLSQCLLSTTVHEYIFMNLIQRLYLY